MTYAEFEDATLCFSKCFGLIYSACLQGCLPVVFKMPIENFINCLILIKNEMVIVYERGIILTHAFMHGLLLKAKRL